MPRIEAEALGALATIARREGQIEDAYRLEGESAERANACGFVWWETNALATRTELALALEHLQDAEENGRRALDLAIAIDERLVVIWVLTYFAVLETRRDRPDRAGRIWGIVSAEVARRPPAQLSSFEDFYGLPARDRRSGIPRRSGGGRDGGPGGGVRARTR